MKIVLYVFIFLNCSLCAWAKKYTVHKDIPYTAVTDPDYDKGSHCLDVYVPKEHIKKKGKGKVLVFIHGGAWKGGSKDSPRHRAVGKSFASNGIITVVINYRLWPETKYYGMADDCARAIAWVKQNIAQYGGNPEDLYVSGHSSGGHLAALVTTDSSYLMKAGVTSKVPIKGCILNDPFGLNMFEYMAQGNVVDVFLFRIIFTDLPTEWMKGSPYYHINKDDVRYYMIYGAETMAFVKESSKEFHERNRFVGNYSTIHRVNWRTHIPMLDLFCHKHSRELKKAVAFMQEK
ncbi:MAG: alpha/beta hydrolase [Chitinophagaceae bacterium]|nr:alpha/beta hydrolase [Chitinophagaceae bacterium]